MNSGLNFTEKEKRAIIFYGKEVWRNIEVPANSRYGYSMARYIDFAGEWIDGLINTNGYRNINGELISRFEKFCREVFGYIDAYYEKWGYEYIYNIPDEEYAELSDINGWEYDEEGRIA